MPRADSKHSGSLSWGPGRTPSPTARAPSWRRVPIVFVSYSPARTGAQAIVACKGKAWRRSTLIDCRETVPMQSRPTATLQEVHSVHATCTNQFARNILLLPTYDRAPTRCNARAAWRASEPLGIREKSQVFPTRARDRSPTLDVQGGPGRTGAQALDQLVDAVRQCLRSISECCVPGHHKHTHCRHWYCCME